MADQLDVLSAIGLDQVQSIGAKRVDLGGLLIITARGAQPIKLECQVGRARRFAEAFTGAAAMSEAQPDRQPLA